MITGLIKLHLTELDDNLILRGPENNAPIAYSVRDLLGGGAVIQVDQRTTGAALTLAAIDEETRRQGRFCQSQIDELRTVASLGQPVELLYHGTTYTVYILEFDVVESDERELRGPNKKYYGSILLQQT